jgi:putative membrane protein
MMQPKEHPRYELTLLILLVLIVIALGYSPRSRVDWALENLLALLLVGTLVVFYRQFRLSAASLTLVFVFLCIHELGAHYTYSLVPYDRWCSALTGVSFDKSFGLHRNHYDRLVHLSYGLLMAWPVREVLRRLTLLRGRWLFFVALNIMLSTSAVYELVEWIGGAYLGDDTAKAFVGAQNDPWDSQKDMALAVAGAFVSLLLVSLLDTAEKTALPTACRKNYNQLQ